MTIVCFRLPKMGAKWIKWGRIVYNIEGRAEEMFTWPPPSRSPYDKNRDNFFPGFTALGAIGVHPLLYGLEWNEGYCIYWICVRLASEWVLCYPYLRVLCCDDVMDSGLMVVRGLDWWCRMKSNRSVNDLSNADCCSPAWNDIRTNSFFVLWHCVVV